MKLRSFSILLSLALVGATASAALAEDKAAKPAAGKKMNMKGDLKMVQDAEAETKNVEKMIDELTQACGSCDGKKDAAVLKGTVDKVAKELKQMKTEEDKLMKQLKSLELEFNAPIGY
jgi:uncharacterized membrane protein